MPSSIVEQPRRLTSTLLAAMRQIVAFPGNRDAIPNFGIHAQSNERGPKSSHYSLSWPSYSMLQHDTSRLFPQQSSLIRSWSEGEPRVVGCCVIAVPKTGRGKVGFGLIAQPPSGRESV